MFNQGYYLSFMPKYLYVDEKIIDTDTMITSKDIKRDEVFYTPEYTLLRTGITFDIIDKSGKRFYKLFSDEDGDIIEYVNFIGIYGGKMVIHSMSNNTYYFYSFDQYFNVELVYKQQVETIFDTEGLIYMDFNGFYWDTEYHLGLDGEPEINNLQLNNYTINMGEIIFSSDLYKFGKDNCFESMFFFDPNYRIIGRYGNYYFVKLNGEYQKIEASRLTFESYIFNSIFKSITMITSILSYYFKNNNENKIMEGRYTAYKYETYNSFQLYDFKIKNYSANFKPFIYSLRFKENIDLTERGQDSLIINELMHSPRYEEALLYSIKYGVKLTDKNVDFDKEIEDYYDIVLFSQDSFQIDYLFVPEKYRENTVRYFYYDNNSDYIINYSNVLYRGIVFYTDLIHEVYNYVSHRYNGTCAFFSPETGIIKTFIRQ